MVWLRNWWDGKDCVLDKDSNKKLELRLGINELKYFDSDLLGILIHTQSPLKIIEEDSNVLLLFSSRAIEILQKLIRHTEQFAGKSILKVNLIKN